MSFTNYPNGLTSFGIPLFGSGAKIQSGSPAVRNLYGNTWFVNAYIGSDGYSGKSPLSPFLTMAQAFEVVQSGDVINFCGKITEQLVTPVNVFDVWVNGTGNRPRHADAVPAGGNFAAAQWGPPASGGVAAQATCRVLQQGWRFTNFLMTAIDTNAACLEIVRNAGAGDLERDASHAQILYMRFSGAGVGVRCGATSYTENPYNVEVGFSQFDHMTTAIKVTGGSLFQWFIHDNNFVSNTNHIVGGAQTTLIKGNNFGTFTTTGINLSGSSGLNQVTGNNLSGTYSIVGGYVVANANDNWYGNASSAGFTAADPA